MFAASGVTSFVPACVVGSDLAVRVLRRGGGGGGIDDPNYTTVEADKDGTLECALGRQVNLRSLLGHDSKQGFLVGSSQLN